MKNFPLKKTPSSDGFVGEFYQTLNGEVTPILKISDHRGEGHTFYLILWGQGYPDIKAIHRQYKKRSLRKKIPQNINIKILKILTN